MSPIADKLSGNARDLAGIENAIALERRQAQPGSRPLMSLAQPVWLSLLVSAAGLLALGHFLIQSLDRSAITSSERMVKAMLTEKQDRLAGLTLTYAYWDEAADQLVSGADQDGVKRAFAGDLLNNPDLHAVHVLDHNNADRLHLVDGKLTDGTSMAPYGSGALTLINRARRAPGNARPVAETAFLGTSKNLFLGSAVRITSLDDNGQATSSDHVMLLVESLGAAALARLGNKIGLPDLHVSNGPTTSFQASLPVKSADGMTFGHLTWAPSLPGQRLIAPLAASLFCVLAVLALSARSILRQAGDLAGALDLAQKRSDRAKIQLSYQAKTDALTGLGNRRHFESTIKRLAATANGRTEYALMSLDLDHLKAINDTLGHEAGDDVLVHAAAVLSSLVYPQDKIFRLGGDEFVILFGSADTAHVMSIGRDAVIELATPLPGHGSLCRYGASAGVAYSPEPNRLLWQADAALCDAKRRGRGQVCVYSADSKDGPAVRNMAS